VGDKDFLGFFTYLFSTYLLALIVTITLKSIIPSDIIFIYTKRKESVNQSLTRVIYGTESTQIRTGHYETEGGLRSVFRRD
jgi:hypothetical protein